MAGRLSRRAVTVLLHGRHARVGGTTLAKRSKNLHVIASAYTREELLLEKGVGPAVAMEIEHWLGGQGLSLRRTFDRKIGVLEAFTP